LVKTISYEDLGNGFIEYLVQYSMNPFLGVAPTYEIYHIPKDLWMDKTKVTSKKGYIDIAFRQYGNLSFIPLKVIDE